MEGREASRAHKRAPPARRHPARLRPARVPPRRQRGERKKKNDTKGPWCGGGRMGRGRGRAPDAGRAPVRVVDSPLRHSVLVIAAVYEGHRRCATTRGGVGWRREEVI
jgi:hypothetical protein